VRLGAAIFATDRSWPIDDLAREVEARGLASLAVPEHTHMPVDHTPYPAGGPLPDHYRRTLDPFVALTMAAAVTSQIELVTGVCLVAQRDPIVTAKAVASLDHVSGGRLTFGVGYGWNRPELAHHGVAFADRRAVVHDRLDTMRSLWTQEVASASGPHSLLGPSQAWPKPLQLPYPPILLGAGLGPRTLADLVDGCDGWLPIGIRRTLEGLPRLRDAWRDAGREGEPIVHVYGVKPELEVLRRLAGAGVERATVWLPSGPRVEGIPVLDQLARLVTDLH
jgi:probable F420-dependent oxidoreductase